MNDPLAMEAAEHLADRAARRSRAAISTRRIENAYSMLALCAQPRREEVARLHKLYDQARSDLRGDSAFRARADSTSERIIYEHDRRQRSSDSRAKTSAAAGATRPKSPPRAGRQPCFRRFGVDRRRAACSDTSAEEEKKSDDDGRRRSSRDPHQLGFGTRSSCAANSQLDDTPLEKFTDPRSNTAAATISGSTALQPRRARATKSSPAAAS